MSAFKVTILVGDIDLADLTLDQVSQVARLRIEDVISNHVLFGLTGATARHISVSVTQLKEVGKEPACTPKKP